MNLHPEKGKGFFFFKIDRFNWILIKTVKRTKQIINKYNHKYLNMSTNSEKNYEKSSSEVSWNPFCHLGARNSFRERPISP